MPFVGKLEKLMVEIIFIKKQYKDGQGKKLFA